MVNKILNLLEINIQGVFLGLFVEFEVWIRIVVAHFTIELHYSVCVVNNLIGESL